MARTTHRVPDRAGAGRFWRSDTRSIVRGVFLGALMVLLVGIGDRLDGMISGGTFPILGGTTWGTIMGVSTLLCRQPGGIIAGLMEGFVSLGFGLSPLSPAFPIVNVAGSIAYSLVAWRRPMKSWSDHFVAQVAGNVVGNALVGVAIHLIVGLPVSVIVVSVGVTTVVATVGGTILTKAIAEAVTRAGLAD
jgi:hypothetical protein